jgi:hypothetical protein
VRPFNRDSQFQLGEIKGRDRDQLQGQADPDKLLHLKHSPVHH